MKNLKPIKQGKKYKKLRNLICTYGEMDLSNSQNYLCKFENNYLAKCLLNSLSTKKILLKAVFSMSLILYIYLYQKKSIIEYLALYASRGDIDIFLTIVYIYCNNSVELHLNLS